MGKDLELEGMLVGHYVGQVPNSCNKPVVYVMQGNGLWEIRRNALGVFCRHASKARIPGLPRDLEEGFELSVPKIPLSLLWQAVAFFRKVYELHQSEAIVRVAYDRKSKRYFLDCPPQQVNAAHCGFDRTKVPGDSIIVAEIHSHGKLSAAFSPTDDGDELADRFYGIVGQVLDFFPQTCFRVSIGGKRQSVELSELFDVEHDPMLKAKFPPGWLDQVKEHKPLRFGGTRRHRDPVDEDMPLFPRRTLDDPNDPENRSMFLPGWDFADYELVALRDKAAELNDRIEKAKDANEAARDSLDEQMLCDELEETEEWQDDEQPRSRRHR
jgi:PRTRC genetic system protein A